MFFQFLLWHVFPAHDESLVATLAHLSTTESLVSTVLEVLQVEFSCFQMYNFHTVKRMCIHPQRYYRLYKIYKYILSWCHIGCCKWFYINYIFVLSSMKAAQEQVPLWPRFLRLFFFLIKFGFIWSLKRKMVQSSSSPIWNILPCVGICRVSFCATHLFLPKAEHPLWPLL